MDYSKTLNLPKTEFPMRAELSTREPGIERFWEENQVYQQSLEKPAPNGDFILHDGPPYSNGHIHMGHALNKTLKDIIVKYKTMCGFRSPYIPGWDNHGMPIEVEVLKEFRKAGKKPEIMELRHRCREYAANWVNIQREEFKRLGVRGDWEHPYLTMSTEYEAEIVKVFGELALSGYIYKGMKPIFWCPECETALAEAEIEYGPRTSPSIYVKFPLKQDTKGIFSTLPADRAFAIIWTTTPWTIPANVALAVHPEISYVIVDIGGDFFLIAEGRLDQTLQDIGAESYKVVRKFKGIDLEGILFSHPIYERDSVVILANFVTLEEGTGIVHIAPGHGREDYAVGLEYGLPVLSPIDERGRFTKDAGQLFEGLNVEEGNEVVIQELEQRGNLVAQSKIEHSYPYCWRCREPVIYRATDQWFLNMDHDGLRGKIIDAIKTVAWYPSESINRITSMIANSPDWCISRQRAWGVGIPVFYCANCQNPVMTKEAFDAIHNLVQAEGSDAWFAKEYSEILPPRYECPNCGGMEFTKETDILDVWFDSGSSCHAVLEERPELHYPADMYLEGSDQHRGWFNKSLVIGVATKGESPFRQNITNGWMLDEQGRTMHKSLGNVISPLEIIDKDGADILRLWASSSNYFEDMRFGKEILKRVSDAYRRIRNTFRFLLANLYDFDFFHQVTYDEMLEIDRWALHKLQMLIRDVTTSYESYEFHKVFHAMQNFAAVELSAFYLDVLKDRLYTSAPESAQRRSAQTALWELLSAMVRMAAPILSYTTEEVWGYMQDASKKISVHLADFPKVNESYVDEELNSRWEKLLEVREEVYKRIEEARNTGVIAKPVEAAVILKAAPPLYDLLNDYKDQLASIFIVSQVVIEEDTKTKISIERAQGEKCERCWLVLPTVGEHAIHPSLCARCTEVVSEVY